MEFSLPHTQRWTRKCQRPPTYSLSSHQPRCLPTALKDNLRVNWIIGDLENSWAEENSLIGDTVHAFVEDNISLSVEAFWDNGGVTSVGLDDWGIDWSSGGWESGIDLLDVALVEVVSDIIDLRRELDDGAFGQSGVLVNEVEKGELGEECELLGVAGRAADDVAAGSGVGLAWGQWDVEWRGEWRVWGHRWVVE